MNSHNQSVFKRVLQSSIITILFLASWPTFSADISVKQSYQSCTIITTELLTTAQLYNRGIPLDELVASLPNLTPQGEEKVVATYELIQQSDLLSTYSAINSDYAKCAKRVYSYQGRPPKGSQEYGFYYCAGENKLRYEIILSIFLKQSRENVIPQLPQSRHAIAAHYFDLAEKEGLESVFDLMATSLKHCVNQIAPPVK
ncbi:hypothetical protein [Alkalimarinus sediminis]|uniref:Uncharacterized protein n=1 Tax=Alkalimarinus sediminis TaxID=1632866 RepID=A0A9E8KR44_9ALTE|nr:hypothetical protein [Alkalimarinus sediminis]UZW75905.1 hypothetical protein NNL22_04810 [Alkalimarinus sediminis]